MEKEELEIQSNVLLGALNALLILLAYAAIIAVVHFYLVHFHEINIPEIFVNSLNLATIPFLSPAFEFMAFLVEDVVKSAVVLSLIYMAYVANYKVEITPEKLTHRKGFLFLGVDEFDIEDIEQVYTKKYSFFPNTRELCIKSLDEDLISIPYVRNAGEVKRKIIELVKARHAELEAENELHKPINAVGGVGT